MIYLDNAATCGIRPPSVIEAVTEQMRHVGGAFGRGQHASSNHANQIVWQCRVALANLIRAEGPETIALTGGCTLALNQAIHGLLREGDHVVTSTSEHNSVLRPLDHARLTKQVEVTHVGTESNGSIAIEKLLDSVRPNTRMVALTAASNVTGAVTDWKRLADGLKDSSCILLCDAAQVIGYRPVDVAAQRIDVLAIPGHKGLMGPLGIGALYVHPRLHAEIEPLIQGGTGVSGERPEMPEAFPTKLEAGNLNVPGIAGMLAGARHLMQHGFGQDDQRAMMQILIDGLTAIPGLRLLGPNDPRERVGVFSVVIKDWSPHELAAILESSFGIQTRAGLHCAPLIHHDLGSAPSGTLRLSLGHFTQMSDIHATVDALHAICQ